jgi:anthranilate phosphoribosyltransferase
LSELGVPVEAGLDWAKRCLSRAGLAFCFAPQFHPALKHVGALRRRLGTRTMLNLLGPLANPASAPFRLLGVGRAELLDPMAGALAQLGIRRGFVVCGCDGLDEVSLTATTMVREIRDGKVTSMEWTAGDFALEPVPAEALRADGPVASARIIRDILAGSETPAARVAVANAAAALLVADRARNLREGVELARNAIHSGSALRVLESLQRTADN